MAARVTEVEVKELISTSLTEGIISESIIPMANTFVDDHLVGVTPALSTKALKHIELLLAAHFVATVEEKGGLTMTRYGDAEETLSDVYSSGFKSTRFGQQALVLDTTGTLTSLSAPGLKAEFRVV